MADKLNAAILQQQSEIDRLTQIVVGELPAAKAKLTALQDALSRTTPGVENLVAGLHKLGIELDT